MKRQVNKFSALSWHRRRSDYIRRRRADHNKSAEASRNCQRRQSRVAGAQLKYYTESTNQLHNYELPDKDDRNLESGYMYFRVTFIARRPNGFTCQGCFES